MAYHTASVARACAAQAPPGWWPTCPTAATKNRRTGLRSACTVLMQAGAHMVKLEGGGWTAPRRWNFWWSAASRVRPPGPDAANRACPGRLPRGAGAMKARPPLRQDAAELQNMGASMLVLEMVPAPWLSACLTETAALPHHRHWRGQRHRRPGAGVARHAGHEPGQDAQVRQ